MKIRSRYILVIISVLLLLFVITTNWAVKNSIAHEKESLISLAKEINAPILVDIIKNSNDIQTAERIYGVVKAYYPKQISDIIIENGDVVFVINGEKIWYAGGRFLSKKSLAKKEQYSPILYTYSIDSIYDIFEQIPKPRENFSKSYVRSSDFQKAIVQSSPSKIQESLVHVNILGQKVKLHTLAGEYAIKASNEILTLAKDDSEIQEFIHNLESISGFFNRNVSQSTNISMHAFGLAFDFIPYSYDNKVTYWQWSRDVYPDTWRDIPLERRWLIPEKIVDVFQTHGFIWGGKWPNYDTMHFEFRPELVHYAQARKVTGSPLNFRSFKNTREEDKH